MAEGSTGTGAMALCRNAPISAQKCRLLADLIRGRSVSDAVDRLRFSRKKGALLMRKVLESAIANAENNFSADIDELWVTSVQVGQGLSFARRATRARGRSNMILRRRSHIRVVVSEKVRRN